MEEVKLKNDSSSDDVIKTTVKALKDWLENSNLNEFILRFLIIKCKDPKRKVFNEKLLVEEAKKRGFMDANNQIPPNIKDNILSVVTEHSFILNNPVVSNSQSENNTKDSANSHASLAISLSEAENAAKLTATVDDTQITTTPKNDLAHSKF